MTIRETLAEGIALLKAPSPFSLIDTPALDAALLLGETLGRSRADLIARGDEAITERDREKFLGFLSRRKNGECIAYILGRREFRSLTFAVNPDVLVPRPDTETLVEAALEWIDSIAAKGKSLSLLDLCTGSGAIGISLKNERPFLNVSASDISSGALEMAERNALKLLESLGEIEGSLGKIRFIESDLFENIPGSYDIIVSNPPYVRSGEIPGLAPEVRQEPLLALDGGKDGMDCIRKIISQAPEHLLKGGVLLLEADSAQIPGIGACLEDQGFSGISSRKDLGGRERVISAVYCP